MKDITSTTFGFIIAFLIPGLLGLFAVALYIPQVYPQVFRLVTADANAGLFIVALLASIAIGLELTLVRWLIYEQLLFRGEQIPPGLFKHLANEKVLNAFRAAADEHYRYHQFWGNISVVLPFLCVGLLLKLRSDIGKYWAAIVIGSLIVEALTVFGAIAGLKNYYSRGKSILSRR